MNGTIAIPRSFRLTAAALLVLTCWGPSQVSAQSTEERIRQLEEQLKAVSDELKALKEQVSQQKPAAAPPPAAEAQAPIRAQPAATPAAVGQESASAIARQAAAEAAATNDRVDKLEQQMSRTWTTSPDGVGWQDPSGRWSAQLFGRLQVDDRTYQPGGMVPDGISIRRARLGAGVTYLKYYSFVLEGEYATGNANSTTPQNASLLNAYLLLDWFRPDARIYLGQFKPQFGLENTGSDNLTDFTERSLQYSFLQTLTYDRGVMVTGAPLLGFNYGVAVTNGTGTNTEEQAGNSQAVSADGKMLTARLTENFAALLKRPRDVYHLGLNYKSGSAANSPSSPFAAASIQTEGRGVVFFNPQAFNAATGVTATNVDRTFNGYELALAHGPVKLQGEFWKVNYTGTRNAPAPVTAYDLDLTAYYLELLWMVTGEDYADWYKDGQFGRIRPRNNFNWKDRTWGGWQVGLRYSSFDGSDFKSTAPAFAGRLSTAAPVTVSANQANAWTLGVTWVVNPYVRFLANYVHTEFDTPITVNAITTDHEDALVFRAQLDF